MENWIQYFSFFIICFTSLFFLYSLFSYRRLIPFYKKFIIPEFFYLCGKKYINLFILFCIISLSLFAMGFGNGLISHLSKKMNDPFVSFVDVVIQKKFSIDQYYKQADFDILNKESNKFKSKRDSLDSIYNKEIKIIETDSLGKSKDEVGKLISDVRQKQKIELEKLDSIYNEERKILFHNHYGLDEAPNYIFHSLEQFENPINGVTKDIKLQQIDLSSKLYKFLVEENKFLSDYKHVPTETFGVIISADWLRNHPKDDLSSISFPQYVVFKKWSSILKQDTIVSGDTILVDEITTMISNNFAIPVVGVVERLPEGVGGLVQKNLFDILQQDVDQFSKLSHNNSSIDYFVLDTEDAVFQDLYEIYGPNGTNQIDTLEKNYITNFSPRRLDEKSDKNIETFANSNYIRFYTGDSLKHAQLKQKTQQNPGNFLEFPDYNLIQLSNNADPGIIQFKFKNEQLDKIEELSLFLRNFKQEVDMSIVQSKENFDLFNKLAISLSIILAFFSIVSVILYITNLVTSHISRNKKNLGTLKAFGLSNANITFIYSCISLGIVFIAFFVSYFLCQLIGTLFIKYLTSTVFNIKDTTDIIYQSYSVYTLCGIFIGIPFLFILFKLTKSLKNSTPGDLIYERD